MCLLDSSRRFGSLSPTNEFLSSRAAMVRGGVSSPQFLMCTAMLALRIAAAAADGSDPQLLPPCSRQSQHSKVFTFFMHDDLDVNPVSSAFTVVSPSKTINGAPNRNGFGAVIVFDDAVTQDADAKSTLLGRSRGFYMFNAIDDPGISLEIQFTLVFGNGSEYPGSTLSYKGYDKIDDVEREISIVGGTGVFRLARGWAVITTETLVGGAANLNIKSYVYYGCDAQVDSAAGLTSSPFVAVTSFLVAATLSFKLLFEASSF